VHSSIAELIHRQLELDWLYSNQMAVKRAKHVVFKDGKSTVRAEGTARALGKHVTKLDAVRQARSLARRDKVRLIIHGRDGRIQEVDSYDNTPSRSKFLRAGR
jgi:hypothetical protein